MNLTLSERKRYLRAGENIVREVGNKIITAKHIPIEDTHDYRGHESSTIDGYARDAMQIAIDHYIPDFEGTLRFELRPYRKSLMQQSGNQPLVLIVDEIEGTTNTKRCLASVLDYKPQAVVSLALSTCEGLGGLFVGAVFTMDNQEVFSAFRVEKNDFITLHNQRFLDEHNLIETLGDSRKRILVIGYSNSHRRKKGELEDALYSQRLKVYEGCRASGMDVINMLRNYADAYIDLRHYWSTKNDDGEEQEAMLQVYDIAGVIPIAVGCGFKVTDAKGESWQNYQLEDTIPLVISRPDIHDLILQTINPFVDKWTENEQLEGEQDAPSN